MRRTRQRCLRGWLVVDWTALEAASVPDPAPVAKVFTRPQHDINNQCEARSGENKHSVGHSVLLDG